MQTENNPVESKVNIWGHRLGDMQKITGELALHDENTLLRLAQPDSHTLAEIADRFLLDDLHIKDMCNPTHPPQFMRLENTGLHIILRIPVSVTDDVSGGLSSVSVLTDNKMCALIWPEERYYTLQDDDLKNMNVNECSCKIIHLLLEHLLHRVYTLREEMDEFEDDCLADIGKSDLGKLLSMRKEFSNLAKLARTNAVVIEKLRAEAGYSESLRLIDAHEHMQRAESIAESRAEHALGVMQLVQSLLSQRLNEIMRFLAVITVIMTPMGVIAGIFGMNFVDMDVLKYPHGFATSIFGMLFLGVCIAGIFKIKKWW